MSTHDIDGLHYHVVEAGAGEPLILLHGFTGRAGGWGRVMDQFSRAYRAIAIDLPGHGDTDSPADVDRYRMERVAGDLIRLLEHLGINAAHWLGYSMGGRLALYITINYPERVRSAILVSASPGLADPAARQARRRDDGALADRIESLGVPAFVDEWEQQPVLANGRLPESARQELRQQRLQNHAHGLANSLRGMGTGVQPSLWHRLSEIKRPVLLLVGDQDEKFAAMNRQMAAAIPQAELRLISEAGHMLHLEQPGAFSAAVLDYLSAVTSEDGRQPLSQGKQDDEDESGEGELLKPRVQGWQIGRAVDGQPVAHQQRRGQQE